MGENPFEELKQFLFDVFESAFSMKKHHFWRVVENQSVGHSEGNFLHRIRQAACTIQRYVEAKNYAAGGA